VREEAEKKILGQRPDPDCAMLMDYMYTQRSHDEEAAEPSARIKFGRLVYSNPETENSMASDRL
jgi:hypothetical protein